MTTEKLLSIAEKNLKSAEYNYMHSSKRKGITETELENLLIKVEYAKIVLDLIKEKNMNAYQKAKEKVRNEAIEWQKDFDNHNYSYEELLYYEDYFIKLAKRYGLVREFKENGII